MDTFRNTTLPLLIKAGVPKEGLELKIVKRGAVRSFVASHTQMERCVDLLSRSAVCVSRAAPVDLRAESFPAAAAPPPWLTRTPATPHTAQSPGGGGEIQLRVPVLRELPSIDWRAPPLLSAFCMRPPRHLLGSFLSVLPRRRCTVPGFLPVPARLKTSSPLSLSLLAQDRRGDGEANPRGGLHSEGVAPEREPYGGRRSRGAQQVRCPSIAALLLAPLADSSLLCCPTLCAPPPSSPPPRPSPRPLVSRPCS